MREQGLGHLLVVPLEISALQLARGDHLAVVERRLVVHGNEVLGGELAHLGGCLFDHARSHRRVDQTDQLVRDLLVGPAEVHRLVGQVAGCVEVDASRDRARHVDDVGELGLTLGLVGGRVLCPQLLGVAVGVRRALVPGRGHDVGLEPGIGLVGRLPVVQDLGHLGDVEHPRVRGVRDVGVALGRCSDTGGAVRR